MPQIKLSSRMCHSIIFSSHAETTKPEIHSKIWASIQTQRCSEDSKSMFWSYAVICLHHPHGEVAGGSLKRPFPLQSPLYSPLPEAFRKKSRPSKILHDFDLVELCEVLLLPDCLTWRILIMAILLHTLMPDAIKCRIRELGGLAMLWFASWLELCL